MLNNIGHHLPAAYKIRWPNLVTHLKHKPTFESCVVRCGSKKKVN